MAASGNSEDTSIMSTINVTPFVDVALVLLVIFMVTAPALVKEIIGIKLPKTESGDGKAVQTLGVAVNRQGQILINGNLASEEDLKVEVKKSLDANQDTQAIISADTEVNYGAVVKVIDILKGQGLNRFAIQVERATSP